MKKQVMVTMTSVVVAAFCMGTTIGVLTRPTPSVMATPSTTTTSTTPTPTPSTTSATPTGPTWHGLSPAPASYLALLNDQVKNAHGQEVLIPQDKPIFFAAPWCPFCHATEQILMQHHWLQRFTIVGVAFEDAESPATPPPMHTLSDAIHYFQTKLPAGVSVAADSMYYAMPGTAVDQGVASYPTMMIRHAGTWYLQVGYNASPSYWKALLT